MAPFFSEGTGGLAKLIVSMPPEPADITAAEKKMREILSDPVKLSKFAAAARARWAKTPAGILATRVVNRWRQDAPTLAGREKKES